MVGAYALDNGASAVPLLPEALAALLPPGVDVSVTQGASVTAVDPSLIPPAVAAAAAADVAIVVLGDTQSTCAEGVDRRSLDLPGGQLALLQALASQTTTPLVVVLLNGRPATFGGAEAGPALLARVGALIIASNPGGLGSQALAEVLLGLVNPSGRLADSWVADVGHIGSGAQPFMQPLNGEWRDGGGAQVVDPDGRVYASYVDDGRPAAPAFPLGWGLSYTTFSYQSITATQVAPLPPAPLRGGPALAAAAATTVVRVTVRVCNTGAVAGSEVVIVYVRDPRGGARPPMVTFWKRVVGFGRLQLEAGACGDAAIDVSADDLALHLPLDGTRGADLALGAWQGAYVFSAGPHSRADSWNVTVLLD